jgi:TolB-like protein/cytochrome c-type biogenesis protein CcmH/NrfG
MAGDEGVGESSEAGAQPLRSPVAGSSRPVFISYASHDAAVAQKVCAALEAADFPCWIAPRNVVPGTMYADGIVHAIDESSILVLILSEQAIASAHVGREIERAVSKRHPVVALRIDAAPLTAAFEYFLNQSQWIEGGGSDAAIAQLVSAVGQHLAPGTAASPTNPKNISADHRTAAALRRRWVIAAVVVAVLLAGGYFLDQAWRSKQVPNASNAVIRDKSIAVLPFTDMSEKKDQEYFSDGLSEELIDMLTKVPDLRVPARTSSFYFKGKQTTIGDIAKALGVTHVLEGSVRKSGDKLRITAQLIRVDSGYHVWSQTFDRNVGDIFQIQDDISNAVVSALKVSLGSIASSRSGATSNTDAYDLYLLAQASYDRANSKEAYQKVVDELQNAIRTDPSFAKAWALLSRTLSSMAGFNLIDPTQGFEDARSAALKAIELSPEGSEGHRALAKILYLHDWNWERAEAELKQALMLGPDDPANLASASIIENILGRADVAVQYATRAVALDPLSSVRVDWLGKALKGAGKLQEAQSALRRAQELNPSMIDIHSTLGVVLLLSGKSSDALAEFERTPDDGDRVFGRALAYYALGRPADADSALRKAEMIAEVGDAYTIAQIHAFRGELDQSFAWLARAYIQRETNCGTVELDPLLKSLRSDPRYKAFLKKMNLPSD